MTKTRNQSEALRAQRKVFGKKPKQRTQRQLAAEDQRETSQRDARLPPVPRWAQDLADRRWLGDCHRPRRGNANEAYLERQHDKTTAEEVTS
jgi:hypothetical protein